MIGIIFVHVCAQKGDKWRHSTISVDLVNAHWQMVEIWHIRIDGDPEKHTHTQKGSVYVPGLVPARRRSSSLQGK